MRGEGEGEGKVKGVGDSEVIVDIKICHGTHGMETGGRNGKLEAIHYQLKGWIRVYLG